MNTIEDYLAILPPAHAQQLRDLFDWMGETFPTLEPRIAWNQPMWTAHGTFILGFSAATKHLSVSPEDATMAEFADRITQAGYTQTARIFRMPFGQPFDHALIGDMITYNLERKKDETSFWGKTRK